MNNLIIFYTIIFFLFINSSSAQNYFPSEIGIKYQTYFSAYDGGGGYSSQYWYSHNIVSDSVINGKRFIKFNQNSWGPYSSGNLYHYDQVGQKLFMKVPGNDTLRLAVDFNVAAGDSFISYLRENKPYYFYSEGIINYQGHLTYKIRVSLREAHWSYSEEYFWKEDLGLFIVYKSSINWASQYTSYSEYRVCSAILAFTLFDPVLLNITTLNPLENRLVTEFPFIMNGNYSSTLVPPGGGTLLPLIDSFYVKVIHLRKTDTLGTYNYPFNNSGLAFIDLIPQSGDKLLIRAIITDITIFNNIDMYPDTGYAVILVLPSTVNVEDFNSTVSFNLYQNYPNPFNPSTTIQYSIPERSFVSLIIYDAMGNEIARPVNEEKNAGIYNYQFDGSALASGVYFYKLNTAGNTQIKKMILIK